MRESSHRGTSESVTFTATSVNQSRTVLPERNLDVMRAMAVLAVLFGHIIQSIRHQYGPGHMGRVGVLAFFVHTSLVLLASIERGGNESGWVRTFYFRRAARIYPLAWATIILCVWMALPYTTITGPTLHDALPIEVAHSAKAIVANVLLVQNVLTLPDVVAPLWTLPLEMQMYLMLPLCFLLVQRGTRAVLGGLLVAIIAGCAVQWAPIPGIWRLSVFKFAPCFLAGVLAFRLLQTPRTSKAPAWVWPVLLLGLGTIGATLDSNASLVAWPFCLVLALLIPRVHDVPANWLTRTATSTQKRPRGAAHIISTYSYGIYLLHMPAWSIAFMIPAPAVVQWAAYIFLLGALPWVAYKLIESPIVEWAKRPRETPTPAIVRQAA